MTDRWKHDRTGDVVPDDTEPRPRATQGTLTKGREPFFELSASWIEDSRCKYAIRSTPNRAELHDVIEQLTREHGLKEAFAFEVDVIDGRGGRRSMTNKERLPREEARAEIARIRDALHNRPSDPPIDLTEPF